MLLAGIFLLLSPPPNISTTDHISLSCFVLFRMHTLGSVVDRVPVRFGQWEAPEGTWKVRGERGQYFPPKPPYIDTGNLVVLACFHYFCGPSSRVLILRSSV